MIADRYDVDPSYFADKYNMPVGKRREPMALPPAEDDADKDKDVKDSKDPKDTGEDKEKKNFFD